jgi:hypothetical protein
MKTIILCVSLLIQASAYAKTINCEYSFKKDGQISEKGEEIVKLDSLIPSETRFYLKNNSHKIRLTGGGLMEGFGLDVTYMDKGFTSTSFSNGGKLHFLSREGYDSNMWNDDSNEVKVVCQESLTNN